MAKSFRNWQDWISIDVRSSVLLNKPKAAKTSHGTNCKAIIAFRFPPGYKHNNSNEVDVDKFGDVMVVLQYTNTHNQTRYTRADFNASTLSRRAKQKIEELRIQGFDFSNIIDAVVRRRHLFPDFETWAFELFKVGSYHFSYRERKSLYQKAFRHKDLDLSLRASADASISNGGMAILTDDLSEIGPNPKRRKRMAASKQRWSFVFMTEWQSCLLKNLGQVDEDLNENIAQKKGDSEQTIDVNIMVTNNETTINKDENKDESELVAVEDVKLNDDVDDDETDKIEDISAYYKNAIIKLEGEVVEFDLKRNVSSSFVPIEADSLSIIDVPARNQKEMTRI